MGPPGKGCRCSLEFDAGICAFDGCICTTSSPAHSEHALHEVGFFANSTQGKTMKGFHRQLSFCLSLSLSVSLTASNEAFTDGGTGIDVRIQCENTHTHTWSPADALRLAIMVRFART